MNLHLIDVLSETTITAAGENYVALHPVVIARQPHMAIFQHPDSRIEFPPLQIYPNATLSFACGIKESVWDRIASPVEFSITVTSDGKTPTVAYKQVLDPRKNAAHRRWMDGKVDLSAFAGQTIRLALETRVTNKNATEYAWAAWANPVLKQDTPPNSPRRRADQHPHVFLITATALGAGYMELYGNTRVKTPNLNALAAEGFLVEQAWTQANTTPGGYASMLTSSYVPQHGADDEWTPLPAHRLSLPVVLHGQGYHTTIIASETEVDEAKAGFSNVFAERLLCRANPAQDGEVTARRFAQWLERRPDQPCFAWIELFDAHPPLLLREPYSSMYYEGDPTKQTFQPEKFARVHGLETLKLLDAYRPYLEQGVIPEELAQRLHDTATALRDERQNGPDISNHLPKLPADARNGMTLVDFSHWLDRQAAQPKPSRELLQWLDVISSHLSRIESEITGWLHGLTDFRYPINQYLGAVTYVDMVVGRLVESLKEQGIYEQSTIIFTSPHGEVLDADGVIFDHHTLHPSVLHVPLVLKLPGEMGGKRVSGVFDLIDIVPTLLDSLGLPTQFQFEGSSRLKEFREGGTIAPHDSFATGLDSAIDSLYRHPLLLVRANATQVSTGQEWTLQPGEERLYRVEGFDLRKATEADRAAAGDMSAALVAWRQRYAGQHAF